MYKSEKQRNANRRPRHYIEGVNSKHDWDKPVKKLKPESSNFLLIISKMGNSIKCHACKEVLKLDAEYDHKIDFGITEKFKKEHLHLKEQVDNQP